MFGSVARGEDHAGSDVDVAVRGRDIDLLALGADLSLAIGREVDVVSLDTEDLVLLLEITRDGRVVLDRVDGGYGGFRASALSMLETDLPWLRLQQRAFIARVPQHGLGGE